MGIMIDREHNYPYITRFMWYTYTKLDEKDQDAFSKLIIKNLPDNDGEKIMATVAEIYIQQGIDQGIQKGIYLRNIEIAKKMLEKNKPISEIKDFTGLSDKNIKKVKKELYDNYSNSKN